MTKAEISKRLWKDFSKEAQKHHICSTEFRAIQKIPSNIFTKTLLSIGESLIGYWDSIAKDEWASLDARALKPHFCKGKIKIGFKRIWIGPAPVGSNIKLIVKKRKGEGSVKTTARGIVIVEKYNDAGTIIEIKKLIFPKGNYEVTKEILLNREKFGFVLITVDTDDKILSFPYAIMYKEIPIKTEKRQVKGFADLHVHQTAEFAFAGNWLHGSMMGEPKDALKTCTKKFHKGKIVNLVIKELKDQNEITNEPYRTHGSGFPSFTDWPHHLDISHQQVHKRWLKQAFDNGMKLMVTCPVNNEILALGLGALWDKDSWRDMPSIKLQIKKIHEFCAKNKNWIEIAYNPWHAREIIHANKLALVISVECSNLFPLDGGHWESQLDELYCMGVRSLQLVHENDNRFAGAAPQERPLGINQIIGLLTRASLAEERKKIFSIHPNLKKYLNFIKVLDKDLTMGYSYDENGNNTRGLQKVGRELVIALMERHMLIDISHYSKKTIEDIFEISKANKYYPLYYSHTKFYKILSEEERKIQLEFLTTDEQIEYIKETGGIVGLRTAPWSDQNACCGPKVFVQPDGESEIGTARNFAQQVTYAYLNNVPFALGTDYNGFTNQLGPRKKDGKKPSAISKDYWQKGLCHIGTLPDLIKDLIILKTPGANLFDSSAEEFLLMWSRTWNTNRTKVERKKRTLKL